MSIREVVLIIAVILSLFLAFSSIDVINKYDAKKHMKKSQRLGLYYISIFIPVLGFILTRRLKRELE